ncbi:hypothetical protein R3P38DRAFT_2812485 [Favolaschia claudopus]|uniref:Uncharacterized protein n=1 Tax=Favolaschia claudopus TaxID=2862362 RepID=A0AAV9Z774_9AGAR
MSMVQDTNGADGALPRQNLQELRSAVIPDVDGPLYNDNQELAEGRSGLLLEVAGARYVRGVTLSSLDFVEIRGVKGTGSFPQQVCPNRSSQQLQLQYYGYTNKNQFYSSVPKYSSTSMRFRKASNVASVSAAVGSFGGKSIISVGMGRRLLMLMLRRAHLHRQRQHLLDLSQIAYCEGI